ncbi:hypothetical protein SODALDRAFT_355692 [Sodiomyces alkalinus F11]|uniref:tRNA wybutosine-synthesizing protein 2 n=1 Tax=Sodiomyces alkalinus (strain CBS 110278 / VKM F-3762 / F11) TaxID=1314773 RepID=A0A3N2Q9R3_SODAK|nr:hypothetical protein SODALDRAFT_355692 [Sodiomyces alkalinus F11]ROT43482.1 hypothetical protein SODALDRAFT_355692 [Sodiomyces alkalinus F11]
MHVPTPSCCLHFGQKPWPKWLDVYLGTHQCRPPKVKAENPIVLATRKWLATVPVEVESVTGLGRHNALLAQTPKRFSVYEPLVLLPAGSFHTPQWRALLSHPQLDEPSLHHLWVAILDEISRTHSHSGLSTHLAINEGIPVRCPAHDPVSDDGVAQEADRTDNVLRSPKGLRMLYGDFGPSQAPANPSAEDFDRALWVSTKQNGIYQTWAPRWTMFSRGNVKEKARLLNFHNDDTWPHRFAVAPGSEGQWAVDLYAGIGYFTFSYARLRLRVLCWELNPWSVEALCRGGKANGWGVKIVKGDDLLRPSAELVSGDERIIVFLEDNREAARRLQDIRASGLRLDIVHVNAGMLPTSEETWRPAWDMAALEGEVSWLHLHENVGFSDLGRRREEIQNLFDDCAAVSEKNGTGNSRHAKVEHVELVKTYAPDVWHCVFDVCIKRIYTENSCP